MISFIGAGPGDPDLITVAGAKRLAKADIVIWASSLVPEALLTHCSPETLIFDSASMTLEDVTEIYFEHNTKAIVRLHSGDPSIYGALQEQLDYCTKMKFDYEIIPGVTSVAATAAVIGRELTIPEVSQSVIFTRLANKTQASMPEKERLESFARIGGTITIFLSATNPKGVQKALLCEGSAFTPDTPAVIAIRTTWPDERIISTTLENLARDLIESGAKRTVLVIVGNALQGTAVRSHLYSPDFAHKFRKRSLVGTTTGRKTRAIHSKL